jgi:hypothetical protein
VRTPWLILLCKFSDHPEEPESPDYFRRWMSESGAGAGGMFDYWRDQSYGAADLTGTTVVGWLTMSHTLAEDRSLSRFDRIMRGIQSAQGSVDFSRYYGITVMLNAQIDSGSVGQVPLDLGGGAKPYGLLCLDLLAWTASWAGHEMGHGFGLAHSFAAGSPDIEYGDPFDIMSAFTFGGARATYQGPSFGESGPNLIAPYRSYKGWLSDERVFWHNALGDADHPNVGLAVLHDASAPGSLMTRVYHEAADPHHWYSVEYRRAVGWDQGLSRDRGLIIHEVRANQLAYYLAAIGDGEVFADGGRNLRLTANGFRDRTAAVRVERPEAREFYYDSPQSSLGPGQTARWTWWFGTAPTLLNVVPIPEVANVPLQCAEPWLQRNGDDTVTYIIDVTNAGSRAVTYHLAAKLTR